MYIDTHCHLEKAFYNNIDNVILDNRNADVLKIIVSGCNKDEILEVVNYALEYEDVYLTLGFHPDCATKVSDEDINWLRKILVENEKVIGVGEIGLDYHYDDTDREKQSMVFRKQLDIAQKYNKPIIVHSRDSIQDTYNILKEYNLKGSIHCFSGSVEMAREFIKLGYKIGIGGIITYKNAKTIKEVVKDTDLAYILLETDSPYLAPVPHRGEDNNPKYIPIIADEIASIKGSLSLDIARVTTANAEAVFDFSCEK